MQSRGVASALLFIFLRKEENIINKLLYEIIISPFGLPVNPILEYLLLAIIGIIAFRIAWDASPGGFFGSIIHYVVRTATFIIMWAVTRIIITVIKWIIANTIMTIVIGASVIVLVVLTVFIISFIRRKNCVSKV